MKEKLSAIFTIGLRYDLGLNEVASDGDVSRTFLQDAKNSALQLYVGTGF